MGTEGMKPFFCLALFVSSIALADESTPADLTIGTQVIQTASPRFGLNVLDALTNNHLRDSGAEPASIRRHFFATGGSATTILVQGVPLDLDFFTTLGNGFFDGANVRVYRSVAGVMQTVRTGTVQTYDVTTGTLTFTAAGAVVQNGDLFFVELLHVANPPFDRFDPRVAGITSFDLWRHMNGAVPATSLAQPAITRDTTSTCPENGGRASLRIQNTLAGSAGIRQGRWHDPDPRTSTSQGFYEALVPGRIYRVDVWLKHSGLAVPTVSYQMTLSYALPQPLSWSITGDWAKYTATFVAGAVPVGGSVIEADLSFSGTGVVWMDNFQVYADDDLNPATNGPDEINAESRAALVDFQPSVLRFWAGNTNSSWGTTLDAFTQRDSQHPPRWIGDRGFGPPEFHITLPAGLPLCVDVGATPWLIMGHTMDESEWTGLIEYLAAPYDPLIDTPATKPWAARRHAQGRTAPWTDAFGKVRIEMSNEMWNSFFVQYMPSITAGQFAQHMFAAAQSSPYYAAVAAKIDFIVNGRILEGTTGGYGHVAWQNAPAAGFSDIATYNGGWELAQQTGGGVFNEAGLGEFLQFSGRFMNPWLEAHAATRAALRTQTSRSYDVAVYETGPGYGLPSPGNVFTEVAERYGKSLAAGTGTLDILLYSSLRGFDPQAFYHFTYGSNWATHSHTIFGGLPHTAWQTLRMRNRYASGSMMNVITHTLPTTTLAANGAIPAAPNFPLVTSYAFRDGNKTTVFLCSRKTTGNTAVTLRLPFSAVSSAISHRLNGAPGDNNRYTQTVTEITEALTPATVMNLTLAPGTTIALEVLGTPLATPAQPACSVSRAPGQEASTAAPAARFAVDFSEPVTGFTASDCTITGSTGASEISVAQGVPFVGGNYVVTVSGMTVVGDVSVQVAAGLVSPSNTASTGISAIVAFAPAPPQNLLYAVDSFDFSAAAQPFPPFLQSLTSGSGFAAGWIVEGANVNYDVNGYRTANTTPLSYGQLRQTGAYMVGGLNASDVVRALDPAAFGTRTVVGSSPAVIGQSGTVLWMSMLMRKDVNDANGAYLGLMNSGAVVPFVNGLAAIGYFGGGFSDFGGQRWWSLSVRNAANNNYDITRSNVPVVTGQTALLVLRIAFGAQDRFDLWVNPAPATLAGADPALGTANATWTTSGATNIVFRTLGLELTNTNHASVDEMRFGETYAAVTPIWTASEQWRRTHFNTHQNNATAADLADPDFDGINNLLEYALNGNPNTASQSALPTLGNDGSFNYSFNPLATDISIVPQWSPDLMQWFNTTPPAGLPRLFRRLQITRP